MQKQKSLSKLSIKSSTKQFDQLNFKPNAENQSIFDSIKSMRNQSQSMLEKSVNKNNLNEIRSKDLVINNGMDNMGPQ